MIYTDILKELVGIDSSVPTMQAIYWVQNYLQNLGVNSQIIYNNKKDTASLVATIGNPFQPGIIFSGHLDVVPVGGDWSSLPFRLTQKGNLLYGRGTTDMKGAIAVALSLVPKMIQSGKTFYFVLTSDEETTAECISDVLRECDFQNVLGGIVMEATECQIIIGHKTINAGWIDVCGKAAHSSQPEIGINALTHAFEIHKKFYELATNLTERDFLYRTPAAVAEITTCVAGTADNVIPDNARMSYNLRCLNAEQQTQFLSDMERMIKEYAATVEGLRASVASFCNIPGFNMETTHSFVQELLKYAVLANPPKVSYATEAGYFAQANIPVVIWGPGDIAQAHQVDEYIAVEQLQLFYYQLQNLIDTVS